MEFFNLPEEYQRLNAAVLKDAAKRYLDPARYVKVTLFPEATAAKK
jgi:hypothetical protein